MLWSIYRSVKKYTIYELTLWGLKWSSITERVVLQTNDGSIHLKNNPRLEENVRNPYSWLTCGSWLASPASHYMEWQGQQQSLASVGEFPIWSWSPWPWKDRCQETRMTHGYTNLRQWFLSASEKGKWKEPHLIFWFLLQQEEHQGRK